MADEKIYVFNGVSVRTTDELCILTDAAIAEPLSADTKFALVSHRNNAEQTWDLYPTGPFDLNKREKITVAKIMSDYPDLFKFLFLPDSFFVYIVGDDYTIFNITGEVVSDESSILPSEDVQEAMLFEQMS